ncbi:MAG: hypothetical protein JWP00_2913 [Chloroflexi bacterium]|jgi:hypothetical protein|nr:hypothetical protein [Chloroflexota bacterium]
MMTENEAIVLLRACKPLADRLVAIPPSITPVNIPISNEDLVVMQGYARIQLDPLVAGPGLLNKLYKLAELSQVEVSKLDQMKHLIVSRRYGGRKATTSFQLGTSPEKQAAAK